ncbi:thiol reductant ABC exporter subunit CydD [Oceanobacillus zhaokaii]|uniref:Thiol reductant ABC exporter subunit CydD n=1 Tax=Oceanobacillus zhaokaii TaxID=2052660 RepID=A0A345PF15_9BACI|nr:thiol reductant ABC exporter subunit CydD [Oceanobacillus zhaokaii]AXI08595.1 thiol reductant ABC exporter subunit CydD [Oceanobacillus zhaokaii]
MAGLMAMAKEQRMKMVLIVISAVLTGAAIIGQSYLFVIIVDRIFLKGNSFSEITPYLLWLIVALLARTLFSYLSGRTGIKMASKVKWNLRRSLLHKFSKNPMQASLQGQSGQKVSVMMDTVDEIDSYFSNYIPQVIQSTIIPIMLLVVIFMEHALTGIIIIFTAPFIPIFMMIIGFNTKDKAEEQLDKMAAFSGKFLDTLQGLTTLKLFGRSAEQKEAIKKSSLDFRDATMVVLKTAFSNSLALEFISMLSIGLIALEVAIRLIIFQDITFFTGFLMLVLAPEFFTKLKDLGSAFHTGRGSMGAAKKLEKELEETIVPVVFGEESLSKDAPPLIELNAVSFSYGENAFALQNIHAAIRPYEQIAIVGKTGSGKSTLLHVIAGLVSLSDGEIKINGKNRSTYREKDWFNQLSYISQDPYLFSGTIAENIAIGGHIDASRMEIEQAAEKAGLTELVGSLGQGFDTPIGEAGRGLSGGEKQRVAIARAFLKRPSIILFDEPTTGLDLQTERILQASIKELSGNSTVITVAHRLHTIKNADKILYVENGELLAAGRHNELLESELAYRNMVTVQRGGAVQ